MITVQNVGSGETDVEVTLTCLDGVTVGTLSKSDLPAYASVTWALKDVMPAGFTASTECEGSATVTSTAEDVVAVNNQNRPDTGATNTFESAAAGSDTLYVPQLSNNYYGWNSALTILKRGSGNTTVTIDYDDGESDTCNLTDASPTCKLFMPNYHTAEGRFAATITSSPSVELLAVAGSTKPADGWSGGTSAAFAGSAEVAVPNVSKAYYGWKSAINCQNVGGTATALNVSYSGYEAQAYNTASLASGDSIQIQVFNETFLPNTGWQGGATINAVAAGGEVVCTVGNSNPDKALQLQGDWTSQYNAYNK